MPGIVMTVREDLDALVAEMEPLYADTQVAAEQARVVAASALSCAFALADALDVVNQRLEALDQASTVEQIVDLHEEVLNLRLQLQQITNSGKKGRRDRRQS
jgi:hypothetical protein